MKQIPTLPISNAMFTATTQCVDCPKCKMKAGFVCRSPSGVIADEPHSERVTAYQDSISTEEMVKRHTIPKTKPPFLT